MRKPLLDQFKVCQKHFQNVLNDIEEKSTGWDWSKFYDKTHGEMKSTIDVLGALIEQVEGEPKPCKWPAPEDSYFWKCNWKECAHGMGLAGAGVCSASRTGNWQDENCSSFETEEEMKRAWKDADARGEDEEIPSIP